ncbi:MAG: 16S rRNA (cytidine(1402)-2'-O)-methyltransferase [Myxococcales bacterium]|nr:16S rRNA (cytidine(1402)-2'-O)-methyltransferase [Myxococcales bacterium]
MFVVATPIGNLDDLSPRAGEALRTADVIAAEDTRRVAILLDHLGCAGRRDVRSTFDGNEASRAEELARELVAGKSVALVSDAGTPGVSDPGARVVRAAIAVGAPVVVIPGPVAAIAALVASGLATDRFLFLGFPPREPGARAELFGGLLDERATMLLYEAPDRVGATLATLAAAFGDDRAACVSRELTKRYEEHVRGPLAELRDRYADTAPRGECVIVVAGAAAAARPALDLEAEVRALLAQGLGPKDVAQRLVVKTGRPRRELYQLALALAREAPR